MPNIDIELDQLSRAQLVRLLAEQDPSYLFKHALTQTSAYESLLLKKRRLVHRRVAEAYESLYADTVDELAALLAYHYERAGEDEKTVQYAIAAGDIATQRSANPEARTHYDLALAALARLPGTLENRRAHVDLMLKRVVVALRGEGPHRTVDRLLPVEAIAAELVHSGGGREDRTRLARTRYWIGQAYLHANQMREAVTYLRQVMAFGESEGGEEFLAIPASMIGRGLAVQGFFNQAEPFLVRAVGLLENVSHWHERIMANGFLGITLAARGNYAVGLEQVRRTKERAAKTNLSTVVALSWMTACVVYLIGGDAEALLQSSQASIEEASRAGDQLLIYGGNGYRALAQSWRGEHDAAQASFAVAKSIAEQLGGALVFWDLFCVAEAELALNAGHPEQAITLGTGALQYAESTGSIFSQGMAHRVMGQALAAQGERGDAVGSQFAASLRLFESGDARLEAARTRLAWGIFYRDSGDLARAGEQLQKAETQFRESGLDREAERARVILFSLSHS